MNQPKPTPGVYSFFHRYVFGRPELVLTLKTASGISVNMDGPFQDQLFEWSERPVPVEDRVDEVVLQPSWARLRPGGGETNVHVHVPWQRVRFVRLRYEGSSKIEHSLRIVFFEQEPLPSELGDELFWFYAFRDGDLVHPLCGELPALAGSKFSAARALY